MASTSSANIAQKKRKTLLKELITIERQIYDIETRYLEDSKDFGNVFCGWDSYLSNDKTKVKKNIHLEDRLFSLSSVTSPASKREDTKEKMNKRKSELD